jgi:hypothetical protein
MSIRQKDISEGGFTLKQIYRGVHGSRCCRKRPLFHFRSKRESREFEYSILVVGPILALALYFSIQTAASSGSAETRDDVRGFMDRDFVLFIVVLLLHEVYLIWAVLIHGRASEDELDVVDKEVTELEKGNMYLEARYAVATYLETIRLHMLSLRLSNTFLCAYTYLYIFDYHMAAFCTLILMALVQGYLFAYVIIAFRDMGRFFLIPYSYDKSQLLKIHSGLMFTLDMTVLGYLFATYVW